MPPPSVSPEMPTVVHVPAGIIRSAFASATYSSISNTPAPTSTLP